ncbi:MAG: dethiobiotin synthase [Candidatus Thermoplasmatota archaeon]|nr:dethiobiotin synthase [Candidatus Thermoplasmatota archaeon]
MTSTTPPHASPLAPRGFFVTGTDTGVGKTRVAVALIHALRAQGLRVAAMKPVSAGNAPGELNEDVTALLQAADVDADLRDVNPYAFAEPVAPHIAAQRAGVRIELEVVAAAYARLAAAADVVVVEGAGGWRVPLNEREDMADLARRLGLPVVLVVGLRLGCLNHALLTAESIANRRLRWAGWVGNHIDPAMAFQAENLAALHARLPAPCLGVQAFLPAGFSSEGVPHTTPHGLQPGADRSPLARQWLTLPEELAS